MYSEQCCELCGERFAFVPRFDPRMPDTLPWSEVCLAALGKVCSVDGLPCRIVLFVLLWLGFAPYAIMSQYRLWTHIGSGAREERHEQPHEKQGEEQQEQEQQPAEETTAATYYFFDGLSWSVIRPHSMSSYLVSGWLIGLVLVLTFAAMVTIGDMVRVHWGAFVEEEDEEQEAEEQEEAEEAERAQDNARGEEEEQEEAEAQEDVIEEAKDNSNPMTDPVEAKEEQDLLSVADPTHSSRAGQAAGENEVGAKADGAEQPSRGDEENDGDDDHDNDDHDDHNVHKDPHDEGYETEDEVDEMAGDDEYDLGYEDEEEEPVHLADLDLAEEDQAQLAELNVKHLFDQQQRTPLVDAEHTQVEQTEEAGQRDDGAEDTKLGGEDGVGRLGLAADEKQQAENEEDEDEEHEDDDDDDDDEDEDEDEEEDDIVQFGDVGARIQLVDFGAGDDGGVGDGDGAGDFVFDDDEDDVEVQVAVDQMVGLRGPLGDLFSNLVWMLMFCFVNLGILVYIPLSLAKQVTAAMATNGHAVPRLLERILPSWVTNGSGRAAGTLSASVMRTELAQSAQSVVADIAKHLADNPDPVVRLPDIALTAFGYMFIILTVMQLAGLGAACLRVLRAVLPSENHMVEEMLNSMTAARAFLKVIALFGVKLIIFPLVIGTATVVTMSRLVYIESTSWALFLVQQPFPCLMLHWVVGMSFMLAATVFLVQLREILHPLYLAPFVARPPETLVELFHSLLDRPALEHVRVVFIAMAVYSILIFLLMWMPLWLLEKVLPVHSLPVHLQIGKVLPVEVVFSASGGLFYLYIAWTVNHHKEWLGRALFVFMRKSCAALGLSHLLLPYIMLESCTNTVYVRPRTGQGFPDGEHIDDSDHAGDVDKANARTPLHLRPIPDSVVRGPAMHRPPAWKNERRRWARAGEVCYALERTVMPVDVPPLWFPRLLLLGFLLWSAVAGLLIFTVAWPWVLGRLCIALLYGPLQRIEGLATLVRLASSLLVFVAGVITGEEARTAPDTGVESASKAGGAQDTGQEDWPPEEQEWTVLNAPVLSDTSIFLTFLAGIVWANHLTVLLPLARRLMRRVRKLCTTLGDATELVMATVLFLGCAACQGLAFDLVLSGIPVTQHENIPLILLQDTCFGAALWLVCVCAPPHAWLGSSIHGGLTLRHERTTSDTDRFHIALGDSCAGLGYVQEVRLLSALSKIVATAPVRRTSSAGAWLEVNLPASCVWGPSGGLEHRRVRLSTVVKECTFSMVRIMIPLLLPALCGALAVALLCNTSSGIALLGDVDCVDAAAHACRVAVGTSLLLFDVDVFSAGAQTRFHALQKTVREQHYLVGRQLLDYDA